MSAASHDILVVVETAHGAPGSLACELLGLAHRLTRANGGRVIAATLEAPDAPCIAALGAQGADQVLCITGAPTSGYETERWLPGLGTIVREYAIAQVLIGHTALGSELGPRLAVRLSGAIATACESVKIENGKLKVLRPCFGGKAREALTLHQSPAVATVRARMHEPLAPTPRMPQVQIVQAPNTDAERTQVLGRRVETASDGIPLESARIIVSGGGGLGGAQGFEVLERLAATVGGAVGASRVAVDLGWCPHSRQIGLSGKTVSPDLYIAVGISGASHHMAGCGKSRTIVAINSDPDAMIFKDATFGVVGDYREIVPALIEAIGEQAK